MHSFHSHYLIRKICIWITGCNGFIGSQLSTTLALKGHEIRLFHRSPITTTDFHPSCKFVAYNNSNLKSVMYESLIDSLPSSIFHLSGCSSVDVAESDPLSLVDLVDSTSKSVISLLSTVHLVQLF